MSDEPEDVGKGRPPKSGQWPKGVTGNPNGRPKGKSRRLPYDEVLGHMMTIRENGVERQVTAEEAFLLYLIGRGFAGDAVHNRLALEVMEQISTKNEQPQRRVIVFCIYPELGDVTRPMCDLGIAKLLDEFRPSANVLLEPWIVQAALERLGDRRFSEEEQRIVVAATRTPSKIEWPAWWSRALLS